MEKNLHLIAMVEHISNVYAAIAKKIEELILLLNEGETDTNTKVLGKNITVFLQQLSQSIMSTEVRARSLPPSQKRKFLKLAHQELKRIKDLESYIELSENSPQPQVIKKINELYRLIKKEIKKEEVIVSD